MPADVKERPIIFSDPMVRAILEGRKNQTRRVVKIQPIDILTHRPPYRNASTRVHNGKRCWFYLESLGPNRGGMFCCKYGEVGERLWVRETWQHGPDGSVAYRASGDTNHNQWKPAIHMPRWASRITLEITSVRTERLQQITNKDAIGEGVAYDVSKPNGWPISRFRELWDSINAKRGFGWENNPWVWVLLFKALK